MSFHAWNLFFSYFHLFSPFEAGWLERDKKFPVPSHAPPAYIDVLDLWCYGSVLELGCGTQYLVVYCFYPLQRRQITPVIPRRTLSGNWILMSSGCFVGFTPTLCVDFSVSPINAYLRSYVFGTLTMLLLRQMPFLLIGVTLIFMLFLFLFVLRHKLGDIHPGDNHSGPITPGVYNPVRHLPRATFTWCINPDRHNHYN